MVSNGVLNPLTLWLLKSSGLSVSRWNQAEETLAQGCWEGSAVLPDLRSGFSFMPGLLLPPTVSVWEQHPPTPLFPPWLSQHVPGATEPGLRHNTEQRLRGRGRPEAQRDAS